jgi:hypothetical protein
MEEEAGAKGRRKTGPLPETIQERRGLMPPAGGQSCFLVAT